MPPALVHLPLAIWLVAGIVVIGLALLVFWLRRNFKTTEVTFKPGPLEVKLERKEIMPRGKSPDSVPAADAAGSVQAAGGAVNINSPSYIAGNMAGRDHITNNTVNMQGGTHIEGGVHTGGGDFVNGTQIKAQTVIKDSVVQLPLPPVTALHQMPDPPRDFTGREAELAELRIAVEDGGVTISGLQGQGGVGKTALALRLADELKPRYPDGQIYLDLQGDGPNPLKPADAQLHVIHAYHLETKLPESETELGGLYRSVLANQRALLLMDNAQDAAQVLPLVPQRVHPAGHVAPALHPTGPARQEPGLPAAC